MKVKLKPETNSQRPVRLVVRFDPPDKAKVVSAAQLAGMGVSEFIRAALAEKMACSSECGEGVAA